MVHKISSYETLLTKIESKSTTVCVVGLGYFGVPLSVASGEAGFQVVGIDVDGERAAKINSGVCYVEDAYSEKRLPKLVSAGKIRASTILRDGAEGADIVIICVRLLLTRKENRI